MDKTTPGLRCIAESSPVYVDGQPITGEIAVSEGNCISTGENGLARITDDGVTAAVVAGPNSEVTPHSPPTISLSLTYYRSSNRYQLRTPLGSVGIRG